MMNEHRVKVMHYTEKGSLKTVSGCFGGYWMLVFETNDSKLVSLASSREVDFLALLG